jgi:sugar phosphate permease
MTSPSAEVERPTRTRFRVLAFLCALSFILYLDRVCISQAVEPIRDELGLSQQQMSFVLMAFTLAYGLFEVPTGHWGDRIGARAVLVRIAIWWSVFTGLTAACTGLFSLVVVRFLFGAGEAGAFPNIARVLARWYRQTERGRVQGLIQTTALLGGTVSPVLAAFMIREVGWRWAFVVFGMVGIVWAGWFWVWFRDDPAQHPSVNQAEREWIGSGGASAATHHESIPWKAALSNPSIWLLGMITTLSSFNSYLYFSWFPTYLKRGRGLEEVEAGALASLVLGGAALGTMAGGFVTDYLARLDDPLRGRRLYASCAFTCAALALLGVLFFDSPSLSALCAAGSCLAAMSTLSLWWTSAIEISGRHLGALFGLMNGMGVFGAMGSQFFFGTFADWREKLGYTGRTAYDPAFWVYLSVLLLAGLCWTFYIRKPVEEQQVPDS